MVDTLPYPFFRRIETAEDISKDMAAARNIVYLPEGQQTLLSLPQ